jgi:hypothetical protein
MARRQAPRGAAPDAAPPKRGLISSAVGKLFDAAKETVRATTRAGSAQARANFPWLHRHLHPVEALDPRFKMPSVAAMGPTENARYNRQTVNLARHAYRNDANIARGIAMVVGGIVGTGPLPCSPFPELRRRHAAGHEQQRHGDIPPAAQAH